MDAQVLLFASVAALLTVTPGADTMLVVRNVLGGGCRAGLVTTLGICAGCFAHAALSGLGVSLILARSAVAFEVLKVAGAAYLIGLGAVSLWRLRTSENPHAAGPAGSWLPLTARRAFLQGFLTNVLNPKVAIFYLAFLPQFVRPTDPALARSILLGAIHVGMGLAWLSLVSVSLGRLGALVERRKLRGRLEALSGAVLIGLGVRLAVERR